MRARKLPCPCFALFLGGKGGFAWRAPGSRRPLFLLRVYRFTASKHFNKGDDALLAAGLWYLAPTAARDDAGALTKELTEALPGCGVWRWNLARGHVHWSSPMYRLLGLEPCDKAMAFRAISQALHPEDDLRGAIDRHLRDGASLFDGCFRLRHAGGHWVGLRLRGHITRGTGTEERLSLFIPLPE